MKRVICNSVLLCDVVAISSSFLRSITIENSVENNCAQQFALHTVYRFLVEKSLLNWFTHDLTSIVISIENMFKEKRLRPQSTRIIFKRQNKCICSALNFTKKKSLHLNAVHYSNCKEIVCNIHSIVRFFMVLCISIRLCYWLAQCDFLPNVFIFIHSFFLSFKCLKLFVQNS